MKGLMMNDKELVWVEKEFAEKYKLLESDKHKTEERLKLFEEYMKGVEKESKENYKANLDNLEEELNIQVMLLMMNVVI
jgi:hypothetical protein